MSAISFRWARSLSGILTLLVGMLAWSAAPALAQEAGRITGQVVNAQTGEPVQNAQVFVLGTNRGSLTDVRGNYVITNVSAGTQQLQVRSVGFRTAGQSVQVAAGEAVRADFQLQVAAVALDEIVVTGRGMGTARREIGTSVATINAQALEAAPLTSMADMLQARSPGVHVLPSGGQPGQGSRILLRGVASLSQRNTPVIYVDGVRMDDNPYRGIGTTGPSWAGFDDINPADVESIEILRGASAATLYGTEAAAGVINITTRRGAEGAPRWTLRSEVGAAHAPQSYWDDSGSVFGGWYHDQFARTGGFHNNQLSLRGGTGAVNYYASGTYRHEGGIEPNSHEDYGAFRTNVQVRARDDLNVNFSAGYSTREVMVPPQGNNQEGFLINALLTGADGHFTPTLPLTNLEMFQRGYRFMGSATAEYAPGANFVHRVTLGGDFFNSDNTEYLPRDLVSRWQEGYAGNYRRIAQNVNLDLSSTFRTQPTPMIRSGTTAGFQAFRHQAGIQTAYGEGFALAGLRTVGATATREAGESRTEQRMVGFFVEQQLGFNDLVFLTLGARADAHSAFGAEVDYELYPKADLSYVVSQHGFWNPDWGTFRLRGAYGTAGMQPGAFSAIRTYASEPGAGGLPAIVASNVGNPELRPEVSHELELGFDANVLNERLNIEFTFFDQRTRDALFQARNIPSMGVLGTQLRNVGEVHNRGVELGLQAGVLAIPGFRWDARVNVSTNRNEVVSLSGEAPLTVRWTQHIREGFPIGGFFESDHLILHNGQVVNKQDLCAIPGECTYEEEFIGPAHPTLTLQLGSDFAVGQRATFGFFFDHHAGHFRHDHTMRWLMDPRRQVSEARAEAHGITPGHVSVRCRAAAEGSLDAAICGRNSTLTQGEFVVPADFWRLREVTFAYRVPPAVPQQIGISNATVTLAGRNLWRWAKTPGLEPESNLDSQSTLQRHSFFPTPIPRQFIAGVTLEF